MLELGNVYQTGIWWRPHWNMNDDDIVVGQWGGVVGSVSPLGCHMAGAQGIQGETILVAHVHKRLSNKTLSLVVLGKNMILPCHSLHTIGGHAYLVQMLKSG